jgi:wyosine [tRNA(Phe)-imidazoG37] synthetase (radical SAM superfamily)
MNESNPFVESNKSTVYGPVKSWRFGNSLGIDPIFINSICSFNCYYCQLGKIQIKTLDIKNYVSTERVVADFKNALVSLSEKGEQVDVITFSGNGEPTLAANLEEMLDEMKSILPSQNFFILTNGTTLHLSSVISYLKKFNKVTVKIDACDEVTFKQMNDAQSAINFKEYIKSIEEFRKVYSGVLEIQTMLSPVNIKKMVGYQEIMNKIKPDAIQLNMPKRKYPLSWHRENRGNHLEVFDYDIRALKQITPETYKEFCHSLNFNFEVDLIIKEN